MKTPFAGLLLLTVANSFAATTADVTPAPNAWQPAQTMAPPRQQMWFKTPRYRCRQRQTRPLIPLYLRLGIHRCPHRH
nr:hypothetical protein 348p1_00008 [Serratia grimesii]